LWFTVKGVFTPWRRQSRWSQFVGYYCLAYWLICALFFLFPGLFTIILGAASLGQAVVCVVELIQWRVGERDYKASMRAIKAWNQVLHGKMKLEDLPPDLQEEIAIQRAAARFEK
jgi:hypothetical protein